MSTIRAKERDAVIQSLRAGVVPRTGQHLIQVGRVRELQALMKDVERIADSGSGFRVVIGEYGSGKTFFLNLVRAIALEKKLVTVHADLNPDRRLHATGGQARSLYAELAKSLAIRTKPEGGALAGVVERFVAQAKAQAKTSGVTTEEVIRQRLAHLTDVSGGQKPPKSGAAENSGTKIAGPEPGQGRAPARRSNPLTRRRDGYAGAWL